MKAVILAGGRGTRLLPLTKKTPKPMLPLGGRPILEHLVEWNRKNGIRSIVICVSYLGGAIRDHFGDGGGFGARIEYATAKEQLDTAGQLKTAEDLVDGSFVCMYGDSLFNFGLRGMIRHHRAKKAFVTMGLNRYTTNLSYGVIRTSKAGRVTGWDEKPEIRADINMGCYVMEQGVFEMIPKSGAYGMDSVIRRALARKKAVHGFVTRGRFMDIGNIGAYEEASAAYSGADARASKRQGTRA